MAPASTPATPKAAARPAGRYAVYVAAVPLRAPQGPAQALMSAGYSLGLWDLQHFMVLLRPDPPRTQAPLVFDFQPRDPEDALAALSVITRSKIPGNQQMRNFQFTTIWKKSYCKFSRVRIPYVSVTTNRCGSEKEAAEDPGPEKLVRRDLRRRRRGRSREVQRAVADRPGGGGARLQRLHQRARRSLDRGKTCPGVAQIVIKLQRGGTMMGIYQM